MNAMAISHTGDGHPPGPRQQTVAGARQISLFASSHLKSPTPPPRSLTTPPVDRDRDRERDRDRDHGRQTPSSQMRSLPSSPRWDSPFLDGGARVCRSPLASPKFCPHPPRPEQPHPQPHPYPYYPRTSATGPGPGPGPGTRAAGPHQIQHHTGALPARDLPGIISSEAHSGLPLSPQSPTFDLHAHAHHQHHNGHHHHHHHQNHHLQHHHPQHQPVENFSRPRKLSIKHSGNPAKLRLAHVPTPSDSMPNYPNGSPPPSATSTTTTSPRRRQMPSALSSPRVNHALPPAALSPSFPPSHLPPYDTLEPRSARAMEGSSPPAPFSRPSSAFSRFENSAPVPSPSGSAPWPSGDDPRSSFRYPSTPSATALGTAAATSTRRSSALSKSSSNAANPDEPSLEDVMGMYERGFDDDDDDDEDDDDDDDDDDDEDRHDRDDRDDRDRDRDRNRNRDLNRDHDCDRDHGLLGDKSDGANMSTRRRPRTAMSEPARYSSTPIDAFDGSDEPLPPVPVVPAAQSALDAEIRQSKMLFASLAFTSTVPAMASHGLSFSQRRNSARTFDSEHSASSDPAMHSESKTASVRISGPAICISRSASPASAPLPTAEPEDPDSRDRYGFKKESQYVTRAQYDAWNKAYDPYLSRRRKKWITYLRDSALLTDRPNRFPAPNAKTKRFVRKGIPPDWRGAAWFYYAGGPAILAKHSGLYDKLLLRKASQVDIEAIERDLHRTFPDNIRFKPSGFAADRLETTTSSERASQTAAGGADGSPLEGEPPIISALRRVLMAFSVYNPKIGYCQSLNFIAGLLLLFVETEEQCFWLLNVITHIYLPGTHEMSLEGSKVDLGVLMTELRDTMPAVWDKIGGELEEPVTRPRTSKSVRKSPRTPLLRRKETAGLSTERLPPITLCMTAWFMSCYIGTLPIETTLRVWDVFFYEGSKTLFRVALAIFKLGEAEIKAVSDPMEMFGVVQTMPRRMLDANQVMESSFKWRNGFNHLSQDVIEERRQERREKVRQDLQRSRGKTVVSNSNSNSTRVVPSQAEAQQKGGTLFGRKKA